MADRFASLLSLLGDDVTVRWLITLMHFLWQGAVVGGLVAIAGSLPWGASARVRYALYSTALLSLPVCVAVTFCVVSAPASLQSRSPLESPTTDNLANSSALPTRATALSEAAQMETAAATDEPVLSKERVVREAAATKAVADDYLESLSPFSRAMLSSAAPWIAAAYLVGVAGFLLRLSASLWGGHRLRAGTARVEDARLLKLIADQAGHVKLNCVPVVAYCERVAVPTVLGVLRPMVLLPVPLMTGLSPDDFAAIIRHELAHIRRYDLWMNLLQRVIESVLFFHPVVWFISRQLSTEREVCCDELVVLSGCEPLQYAGALLRTAELCAAPRQSGVLALAATGDRTPLLERRIEQLMNWSNAPRLQLTGAGMAGLLMTFVSLIVLPTICGGLGIPVHSSLATENDQSADEEATWIRGSGEELEIRVHGEIVGVSADEMASVKLSATYIGSRWDKRLSPPSLAGNRFEWWVPVNRHDQSNALRISASSTDGMRRVTRALHRGALRQSAIDGLALELQPASKAVEIAVTYNGDPIADAHVIATVMQSGDELRGETDSSGIFRLNLLPLETLFMLTVWTDDYKFASYDFARLPDRDPAATAHAVELEQGCDKTIRVVDRDGSPVADFPFLLNVVTWDATCFLYGIDQSRMRTDEKGETVFHWYPNGEDTTCSAYMRDDRWTPISRPMQQVGEVMVLMVKPSTKRKRIVGKVIGKDREVGGIHVELESFQSDLEGRIDALFAFTDRDGTFEADVLPDATYCIFVNDVRRVSDPIDLIPYRSMSQEADTPVLHVMDGHPIHVQVTAGLDRHPVANQFVNLRASHRFQWFEDGESKQGRSGRAFRALTDHRGIATAYAAAGSCEVSVYQPDWRASTTVVVGPDQDNIGHLHRETGSSVE